MSVTVVVADPRRDPEPAGWSRFATDLHLHAPWHYPMMAVEARTTGNPLLLAVATAGGRVVAGFALMVCRRGGALRAPGRVGGPARWTPRWVEVCHPWQSGFPGWAFADDLDEPARVEVVRAFERTVCRTVGPGCLGVVYRCLYPQERPLVAGRLRLVRDIMGDSVLTNRFATMEEWVSSLSRGRRHAIRGQLRAVAADQDLRVCFAAARDDLDGTLLAAMLDRHRASFGRRLLLDHPTAAQYYHWATLGRDEGGRRHLYFDSYARMVQRVVAAGRGSLSAGRGLPELKATLGFTERPRCAAVVPRIVAG